MADGYMMSDLGAASAAPSRGTEFDFWVIWTQQQIVCHGPMAIQASKEKNRIFSRPQRPGRCQIKVLSFWRNRADWALQRRTGSEPILLANEVPGR